MIMNAKKAIVVILETALRIIVLLIIISCVYKTGLKAYDFGYRIFAERPMTLGVGRDVIVTIPEDKNAKQVGDLLKQRGLIRDANLFFCQELLSASHGKIKPGTYTLNTGMTAVQMMEVMSPADDEEGEEEEPKAKEEAPVTKEEPEEEELTDNVFDAVSGESD